ncbi:MAG: helix-turn-helix transcriptional regulator [Candidatus Thorarchaeota archaeon]|nr:helix-turn-helix transcriptional regulator [Candidatus Thorarchaeota archaeon]
MLILSDFAFSWNVLHNHQIKRDILRTIGEQKGATFTEIKKAVGIEESAALSYHLRELDLLLVHDKDLYKLSDFEEDAYSLLNKLVTHSSSTAAIGIIRRKIGSTIITSYLIWASALGYLTVVEARWNS